MDCQVPVSCRECNHNTFLLFQCTFPFLRKAPPPITVISVIYQPIVNNLVVKERYGKNDIKKYFLKMLLLIVTS